MWELIIICNIFKAHFKSWNKFLPKFKQLKIEREIPLPELLLGNQSRWPIPNTLDGEPEKGSSIPRIHDLTTLAIKIKETWIIRLKFLIRLNLALTNSTGPWKYVKLRNRIKILCTKKFRISTVCFTDFGRA